MKYVINDCYGGFGLSNEAFEWLIKYKDWAVIECNLGSNDRFNSDSKIIKFNDPLLSEYSINKDDLELRCNPDLVECVETLKEKSFGGFASLTVVECDLDMSLLEIHDYDGVETLQTIPVRFN